ncbi:MAG: DUF4956 domain-containing protein [Verrucomicrobia bacterium]|nr:DUF4956 domain-containing protein [Verrucomicrobiota bacterium]
MPDWLRPTLEKMPKVSPEELFFRLVLAAFFGWLVSVIYRRTRSPEAVAPSLPTTLVLLTILIAIVTQVIGDQVARAFSLVGALSIVRFRTVVRDTQDTAFVVFAVIIGMAVGTNDLLVALIGTGVVGGVAFVLRPRGRNAEAFADTEFQLVVRAAIEQEPEKKFATEFEKYFQSHEFVGAETAKQGSVLELSYRVRLRESASPPELVKALKQIEGVQNVELRRGEPVET